MVGIGIVFRLKSIINYIFYMPAKTAPLFLLCASWIMKPLKLWMAGNTQLKDSVKVESG